MRDPSESSTNHRRVEIGTINMIGALPGTDVHCGLVFGIVAAIASYVLIYHTVFGFTARITGGNIRAAKIVGLRRRATYTDDCFLAGGAAGLAGMIEVAASRAAQRQSRRRLWLHGDFLVAFLARQHPLAVIPVAILLGGISASGGLCSAGWACRTRPCWCFRDCLSRSFSSATRCTGRIRLLQGARILNGGGSIGCGTSSSGSAGAIRGGTPFLLVSLGECHHRTLRPHQSRSRRHAGHGRDERLWQILLSLGLALARRACGAASPARCSARLHAGIVRRPRVNDIAVGIALMLFGNRSGVLSRQAADRADRRASAGD